MNGCNTSRKDHARTELARARVMLYGKGAIAMSERNCRIAAWIATHRSELLACLQRNTPRATRAKAQTYQRTQRYQRSCVRRDRSGRLSIKKSIPSVTVSLDPVLAEAILNRMQRCLPAGLRVRTPGVSFYEQAKSRLDRYARRFFDESKHPRAAAGGPDGGQFVSVTGGTGSGSEKAGSGTHRVTLGPHKPRQLRESKAFPGYLIGRDGTLFDRKTNRPVQLAGGVHLPLLSTLLGALYRDDFIKSLTDAAKELFDAKWQVHHRYQQAEIQELQDFFKKFNPKHDVHSLDNLVGVPAKVHGELNNLQGQFWEDEYNALVKKGKIRPEDLDPQHKIKAVLKHSPNQKKLFARYKKLVDHIDTEYASYIAKPRSGLTRLQSISTNLKTFEDKTDMAKRMIAHAKAMNPKIYKQLQRHGGLKQVADDLIEAEKRGQKSGKFSKALRFIGIGTLLMMAGSVALGARSAEANDALTDFIVRYENVAEEERTRGYPSENQLQLLIDSFRRYLKALNIPEDTVTKIDTLLRLKIGLNYDADGN